MAFTSAAAGLLALVVIAAGTAMASTHAHHASGTRHPVTAKHKPAGKLTHLAAPSANPRPPRPYGAVIDTGIRNAPGELVFYGVHVHAAQLPQIKFGFMGGYRNTTGHLSADVIVNEFIGSDVSPGFHWACAPSTVNGQAIPEFGYYAGPAVKITGTLDGQRIRAGQAQWSVNPKIVVFWFSPADNPRDEDVTSLAAFNVHGRLLPRGHNGITHG
jgi:hypothetical protein